MSSKNMSPIRGGAHPPPPPAGPPPPEEFSGGSWYEQTVGDVRQQIMMQQQQQGHPNGKGKGKGNGGDHSSYSNRQRVSSGDVSDPHGEYGTYVDHGPPKNHHKLVPRKVDFRKAFEEQHKVQNETPITTLMIRNIPNRYTQMELLEEIDTLGFPRSYDFFYMPVDAHNRCNVGYGFINFRTPEICRKFQKAFRQYRYKKYNSRKIGEVTTAHSQGLKTNIVHFRKTRVVGWDTYTPLYFRDDGTAVSIKVAAREVLGEDTAVSSNSSECGDDETTRNRRFYNKNADQHPSQFEHYTQQQIRDFQEQNYYGFSYDMYGNYQMPMVGQWPDHAAYAQPFYPQHYGGPLPHEAGFQGQYYQGYAEGSPSHQVPAPEAGAESPDAINHDLQNMIASLAGATTPQNQQKAPTAESPEASQGDDTIATRKDATEGNGKGLGSVFLKLPNMHEQECPRSVPTLRPKPQPDLLSLNDDDLIAALADLDKTGLTLGVLTGLSGPQQQPQGSMSVQVGPKDFSLLEKDQDFRREFVQLDLGVPALLSDKQPREEAAAEPSPLVIPNTGDPFVPLQPEAPPSPLPNLPQTLPANAAAAAAWGHPCSGLGAQAAHPGQFVGGQPGGVFTNFSVPPVALAPPKEQ